MIWTDKNTDTLESLWAEGKSAAEISKVLGTTRNSVLGKLRRMGIRRQAPGVPGAKPARPATPRPPKVQPPVSVAPVRGSPMSLWTERNFGECAFPIVKDDVTYSCCADTEGHRAYCPKHQRVMYAKTTPFTPTKLPRLKTDGRHIT
jgi:hypothetical protein